MINVSISYRLKCPNYPFLENLPHTDGSTYDPTQILFLFDTTHFTSYTNDLYYIDFYWYFIKKCLTKLDENKINLIEILTPIRT